MALFGSAERRFAEVLSQLVNCNPFLPRWVELEREALGPSFRAAPQVHGWQSEWAPGHVHPNLAALGERATLLAEQARQRLAEGRSATEQEHALFEDLALYHLYRLHGGALDDLVHARPPGTKPLPVAPLWGAFHQDFARFFPTGSAFRSKRSAEQMFAWFFQLRRAFHHIYHNIIGVSGPAARLRGAVWQSIFTHDMRRWARSLYARMGKFPTLITGPSGTGKEPVARAVGLSRYVPFDPDKKRFADDCGGSFHPLNLSALAPTLIESELFGHKKGSFTGAISDRTGRLQECDEHGTVFLDEIGELDAGLQVKLLRVLQTGRFERLGESAGQQFEGKIIAATNRDLAAEMRAGRFREDFYYRLCADRITTPSLHEQLTDAPEDLSNLLLFIARQVIGDEEAEGLATEVGDWIEKNLGRAYPWPGNFRELEQCVRNVMIRQAYQPAHLARETSDDPRQALATAVIEGRLTAEELGKHYFTLVYAQAGSYEEAAQRLKCNWRTLRSKIDHELLEKFREQRP